MREFLGFTLQQHLMAGAAIVAVATASPAMAQTRQFNVPAQSASRGIPTFARQAGVQIIASGNAVSGRRTNAVRGNYSVQEGLRLLLNGTGLVADGGAGGIIAIRAGQSPVGESQAGSAAAADESADVVVVGTRIPGRQEGPVARVVLSHAQIAQLGATNVADVLGYLPQQPFSNEDRFQSGGFRTVRLRGLGVGTTLVLINGRRTVTSALNAVGSAFDLNTIPLSAVDRIEILTDSASAVYGADAVGGVVNIVLNRDIGGPRLELYHGGSEGGGEENRVSAAVGMSEGRLSVNASFDYYNRAYLLGEERDRSANQDFRRFGGADFRVQTANPGNICAVSGNLPGLSAPCAAVPVGSTGVGLTPASFVATAGQTNLESTGRFGSLIPKSERYGATVTADFRVSDRLSFFGEFMWSYNEDARLFAPAALPNLTVPASNAFNPFGVPVRINYLLTGIGPIQDTAKSETTRFVAGVRGRVGSWDWEAYGLKVDGVARFRTFNQTLNVTNVFAALASSVPSTALNVFQDGPGGSETLLASLLTPITTNRFRSNGRQFGAQLRGRLFALPGGDALAVVGGEVRRESVDISAGTIIVAPSRNGQSVFAELRLPFVSANSTFVALRGLTVSLAGRYDHYEDFGNSFNPQVGVELRPVSGLLLRGAYSTSFRAPSLFQLYAPRTSRPITFQDPNRNNAITTFTFISGGNLDLEPEESESWSVGIVLTPLAEHSVRIAGTYWSITQDLRIQTLNANLLLANESLFPDRVVRGPRSASDIAANIPGPLLSLDGSSINYGSLKTSGIDISASASFDLRTFRLTPNVAVTWVDRYVVADLPGTPAVDRVGVANSQGTVPEWIAVASLVASTSTFDLSATVRYVSSYDDVNTLGATTGRRVGSTAVVDVQSSMNLQRIFPNVGLGQANLRFGIRNLFNLQPPFATAGGAAGYDPTQGNLRGRFAYVSLTTSL